MIAKRLSAVNKSLIRAIFDTAPKNAINLGIGELQFPHPTSVQKFVSKIQSEESVKYSSNAGLPEMRSILAKQVGQNLSYDNFVLTSGAAEALFAVLFTILDREDEIIIPNPDYPAYQTISKMLGATIVEWQATDYFTLNLDTLDDLFSSKTKAILLSNPCNPTGKVLNKEQIIQLSTIAKKHNCYLILDEIYQSLFHKSMPFSGLALDDNEYILTINGLSKSHCFTGWRIGWIASKNKTLIQKCTVAHQYIATCAPYISQRLIAFAYSTIGKQWNINIRKKIQYNFTYLEQLLIARKIPYIKTDATPYCLVEVPINDIEFCKQLAKQGVVCTPLSAFGKSPKNWVRISFGLPLEAFAIAMEIWISYYESL